MSDVSKSVAISPSAAAAAGCTAQCPGVQTDYSDGWSREYTLSASAASGWRFVKFTWSKVRRTASGTTPIGDYESSSNPSTAADGLAEARVYGDKTYWQEDLIENIVAHFEQAPVTYTITTAVAPAGSGTATGGGTFNSGASCTLTATPASGYSFVRWEKNGAQVSTSASYTFTVSESATYTAIFESAIPLVHIVVTTFKSVGRVTLNGIPGDDISSAWTTVSAYIPVGDPVIITATPIVPNVHPFKAWYLNPSAWGNPEQTGTLVSGAGATYTFAATANATYFATFESGGTVVVSTTPSAAQPEAKVSINGQTNNTYEYSLDVPTGGTVTVSASERGGPRPFPYFTMYYFEGWIDNDYDSPTYGTTLSTDRVYTFQLAVKQGYEGPYSYASLLAKYAEFEQIETEVMPDVAMGSISASPPPKDGEWFRMGSTVTFTATPSPHYRFVKWTEFNKTTGREFDYSTNNQITFEVGTQPRVVFRAYFEWDGTDLLVNSANLSSPVQLVYDSATNLLVADY